MPYVKHRDLEIPKLDWSIIYVFQEKNSAHDHTHGMLTLTY